MMSLTEQLNADLKQAMREKDQLRLETLRMVRAELLKLEKDGREGGVSDDEAQKCVARLIKQRRDAAEQFRNGNRPELAEKEDAEADLLKVYLPEEVGDDEINAALDEVIAQTGASAPSDIGKVMGITLGKLKKSGKMVDGKKVNELARAKLSG
jgi:uncharacterized protein YqeY